MYSIIYQYVQTQVLHALYTKYQQNTLFIVTDKCEEIKQALADMTHHTSTVLQGEGGYTKIPHKLIYVVVSRAETPKTIQKIKDIDPHSFVNVMKTERVWGKFYQKPME